VVRLSFQVLEYMERIEDRVVYTPVELISREYFFIVSWGGVKLSPLGSSVTIWPIVPALDDR
jgi:hypothetical protein